MKPCFTNLGMALLIFTAGCATAPKRSYTEVQSASYRVVKQPFVIRVKAEMGWPVYEYPIAAGRYRSFIADQFGTYYYPVGEDDGRKVTRDRGLYLLRDASGGATYFWPGEFMMALPTGGVVSLTGTPERKPVPLGKISPEDMKKIEDELNPEGSVERSRDRTIDSSTAQRP
jgi:hypothetical protein